MKLFAFSLFLTIVAGVGIILSFFLGNDADPGGVLLMRVIFGIAMLAFAYTAYQSYRMVKLQ